MEDTHTAPLWRTIAEELHARIRAGRYTDAFPGEIEVAAEFDVSRGTARAALRPLREAGLITAGRGRKPQLAQRSPDSPYGAIYSLHDLITSSGLAHSSRVLRQTIGTHAEAARELGLAPNTELFQLERVRYADGTAVAHDEIFSPAALTGALVEVDFSDTAFYRELRERCGITVHGGSEQIDAVSAGAHFAELLDCAASTALLRIERVACSNGTTVEFRRSHFLGDRFRSARPFGETSASLPCGPAFIDRSPPGEAER